MIAATGQDGTQMTVAFDAGQNSEAKLRATGGHGPALRGVSAGQRLP